MDRKLNRQEIDALMPHGEPFLFIDSAEIGTGSAKMKYKIRGDEFSLRDISRTIPHFPRNPDAGSRRAARGALPARLARPRHRKAGRPKKIFFTSSDNARCSRFCLPGDTLDIELKVSRIRHPLFFFEGRSFVGGERASFVEKITLTFDYKS